MAGRCLRTTSAVTTASTGPIEPMRVEIDSTKSVPIARASSTRHPQMAVAIQGRRGALDDGALDMATSVPETPHPPTGSTEQDQPEVGQCPNQDELDQRDDGKEDEEPGH